MRFGVLGHLEVCVDPDVIKISSARQRIVLAALLTRANQVVSSDELAEFVWDCAPPAGARTTLRSYVMRLRRSIGPVASARLRTREPGYLIEIADDELDLLVFRQRFQRGRRAERAGAWHECSKEMTAALQLWRGEPLSDVPAHSLLSSEVPRLVETRLQALESRINAELQLSRHDDVIGDLVELVVAHPLREPFVAQLMLALYRAGRQAEALDTYGTARQRLVDELGIEPSREVRHLHRQILANDPSLMPADRPVLLGEGAGAVLVPEPVSRPSLPVPRQLPHTVRDFTGRQSELKRIATILEQSSQTAAVPIVHIHGAPGVGKTSLAVLAAHRAAPAFPDGQLLIPLTGESGARREADEVVTELLRTLGAEPSAVPKTFSERVALYRSLLAGKRMLLLIDDARDSAHILPLMPGVAGCGVIVTSRTQNIHLSGAHLFELHPFSTDESLLLLRKIIGNQRIASEREAAGRIVEACEGIPLAIRIAGDRLATRRTWSLSYLADMLAPDSILDTLTCQEAAVRTAIAHSYEELGPDLQRAFRYLSLVGPHDFSSWTAALVLDRINAEYLVEALRDHSLLLDAGSAPSGKPRYQMLGLFRQYAKELLLRDPEFTASLDHIFTLRTKLADFADAQDSALLSPSRLPVGRSLIKSISTKVMDRKPSTRERGRRALARAVEPAVLSDRPFHALELAVRRDRYLTRHHLEESESIWRLLSIVTDTDERIRREARYHLAVIQETRRSRRH